MINVSLQFTGRTDIYFDKAFIWKENRIVIDRIWLEMRLKVKNVDVNIVLLF